MMLSVEDYCQVYLVVGGWVTGGATDSVETLVEGGSAWTIEEPLWTGIADARMLTYNNIPYMFGGNIGPPVAGWDDFSASADILAWDDRTKKWSKTGLMKEERIHHGVSAIEIDWDTLNSCQP